MRGRGRKGPNPLTRSYESNGPDVKIRGTAQHIADKYAQLARDASASGDRVMAENYLQHAEHYNRVIAAAQGQFPQQQRDERDMDGDEDDEMQAGDGQPFYGDQQRQPNGRDNRDGYRDGRDDRENRNGREYRDNRDGRDNRDNRDGRDRYANGSGPQPSNGDGRDGGEGREGGRRERFDRGDRQDRPRYDDRQPREMRQDRPRSDDRGETDGEQPETGAVESRGEGEGRRSRRRRERPDRFEPAETSEAQAVDAASAEQPEVTAPVRDEEREAPAPRRRVAKPAEPAEPAEAAPETSADGEAQPKRRGRPRKKKPEDEAAAGEGGEEHLPAFLMASNG
ncbi:DUF4167 domain-containing protein [Mangrovibrevibacter kandeliae]|uniref:DUF4167 domain-containing protein n=1 Tax=Mangrovibrevibacter kandeliae TaxID=2968473 RepID=UPI0021195EFA|nr:DUF4167 domain-containing protein [Aurantimonas sp. CSK15Z-1]MCQ8783909.1 DUF4167 domain-containing protein [Aurantimonas sp. CSK15Z-1]